MNQLVAALLVPLSMLGTAQTTINSNICHEIITPTIASPADQSSLTSRSVQVRGSATSQTSVVVAQDGVNMAMVTADSTNSYSVSIAIPSGSHTLGVTSTSPCQSKAGASITVYGMADPAVPPTPNPPAPTPPPTPTPPRPERRPPVAPGQQRYTPDVPLSTEPQVEVETKEDHWISVEAPSERDMVGATRITLSGKMSSMGTVVVTKDGRVVAETYRASTSYALGVPVDEGNNTFVVTATIDGQKITREITVYVAPKEAPSTGSGNVRNDGSRNIWPWIVGGGTVVLLLIISGFWWFLIGRRRRREEQDSTTRPPFGGGL